MKKLLSIFALSLLVLSACGEDKQAVEKNQNEAQKEASHEEHAHASGDIQEETTSADVLPSFLNNKSEDIRLVYQIAGQSTEILEWMPCYCGCGESAGHKSNLNCFIEEKREDGTIVWDDHGTRCLVCLEIAVQSAKMHKDGMDIKEIRQTIDNNYKEGYAKPTPTDMPA
ncbi:lipoprotein [Lysinibacillus sphaericus]|uniref:PCYCGC motif-containing (lipo)protein n=1 Tax=Lysinibacillus sphaericus TaxID=1421 RepID=UPI0018CFAB17|nr:PCYCGC motif-containing (lipo)protein [Lysinibacillus sphaericus]MBG9454101.1 lipoprotein [Lysinibacillus sphaericus]MBG9477414.1 lipoprotein [Lysinibacillus sphaericus]MBG9593596.1 lipoprotein [Lysinibacillus sphaericus]